MLREITNVLTILFLSSKGKIWLRAVRFLVVNRQTAQKLIMILLKTIQRKSHNSLYINYLT